MESTRQPLAHLLLAHGVCKGDRIGVLAQNCAEMLDLLFACGKVGAIYVPFNWRLTLAELEPLLANSEPRLLFVGPQFEGLVVAQPLMVQLKLEDAQAWETFPELAPEAVALSLEDPWMILYTGGTTGRSKGALISHRQALWNAWNTISGWGLSPDDRVPILTPFFHTGGLNVFTTPLVQLGGTSVLLGTFSPAQVLEAIELERLTVLFMVPTMFQMLMNQSTFAAADFRRLRLVVSGGAPCPHPVYEAYWARGSPSRADMA